MPAKSLLAVLPLIVSLLLTTLETASGVQAAQDASPVATPAGSPPLIETLVATTFSADTLPTTSSRSFLIWHATMAPGTEVAIPADLVACCPGPQIEHVLAGELTLLVEGPLQVVRGAPEGTSGPTEEVAPGTEVVLRPGDTALYALELPVTYHNAGSAPVQLVAGGLFAGSPPAPPADYAIASFKERYPAPPLSTGPLAVTLQRSMLAPEQSFPAPPAGAVQVVMPGPELGSLGERSDGSSQNVSQKPLLVYALILQPAASDGGTPIVS